MQVSQEYFSPFGPRPQNLINATDNRYTAQSYRVSPFIRGETGTRLAYELRNNNTWTKGNIADTSTSSGASTTTDDAYTNEIFANVTRPAEPLGWGFEFDRVDTRFTRQDPFLTQIARARAFWRPDPEWELSATGGYEDNQYPFEDFAGATYGVGGRWRPNALTSVEATVGASVLRRVVPGFVRPSQAALRLVVPGDARHHELSAAAGQPQRRRRRQQPAQYAVRLASPGSGCAPDVRRPIHQPARPAADVGGTHQPVQPAGHAGGAARGDARVGRRAKQRGFESLQAPQRAYRWRGRYCVRRRSFDSNRQYADGCQRRLDSHADASVHPWRHRRLDAHGCERCQRRTIERRHASARDFRAVVAAYQRLRGRAISANHVEPRGSRAGVRRVRRHQSHVSTDAISCTKPSTG